jgi:phosphatidate cytidylyltransferase
MVVDVEPGKNIQSGPACVMGHSNLFLRVLSALVLVPIAVAAAYLGGLVFLVFWTIAALGVLWEWDKLVLAGSRHTVLAIGAVTIVGSSLLLAFDWVGPAAALVVAGAAAAAVFARRTHRSWCAAGVVYASALLIAPVLLRGDATFGFAAIIFVFVIVWLTDIVAYFVGRAVGGPKLMVRVSPNKTWSGAIGGTLASAIGGVIVASQFGLGAPATIVAIAVGLSIVSQAGDLLESAIKRRFNAKDASNLIPGHGGLMDRLDGFVTAVAAAAVIGLVHAGFAAPARGLMVW